MISIVGFRMEGAQRFRDLNELQEQCIRPASLQELRAELLQQLPPGTIWPEGSNSGEWHGSNAEWIEIKVDGPHSFVIHTWGIQGAVDMALARIWRTNRWFLFDLEATAPFVPGAG